MTKIVVTRIAQLLFVLMTLLVLSACLHDEDNIDEPQPTSFKFYTLALFDSSPDGEPIDIESVGLAFDIEDQMDAFDVLIESVANADIQSQSVVIY